MPELDLIRSLPRGRRQGHHALRLLGCLVLAAIGLAPSPAPAQTLGAAESFALLGRTAVTGNGGLVDGDVGVSPGTSITGFPPTLVALGFGIHSNDGPAMAAQVATATLYGFLVGQVPDTTLTAQLNGVTVTPGVYRFAAEADIASGGNFTLDGSGTYIFQVGSALTANVGSRVTLTGGATPCNVFWQVTSAATLNGITFPGTVVAQAGVTLGVGATLTGRALVTAGPVTMAGANLVGGCSGVMACAPITLAPLTLPNATVGAPYLQQVSASGGTAPYTFAVTVGALPPGLVLLPDGTISGVPIAAGVFAFRIQATDANGCFGARNYTLTTLLPGCLPIDIAPANLPPATRGVAFSQQLSASGGTAPYTFALTSGALAPGLTLLPNGLLSGVPTSSGVFNFTIQATDANGCLGARDYIHTVTAPGCLTIGITPPTLPDARLGVLYNQQLTANGGTAPYTFTVTTGALPPGLVLSPTGLLSGIPTSTGVFSFRIQATDVNGCFRNRAYTLTVACPPIAISPTILPDGLVGVVYSQQLTADGGTAPYTFAVSTGALPGGLTLSPTGLISGTPTTVGVFTFRVRATDANACSANPAYAITIMAPGCSPIALTPTSLPAGTVGVPYDQVITATGGTPPYTFTLASGALPNGLTLSPAGPSSVRLSGTPLDPGDNFFAIQATDALGCFGAVGYTLSIVAPAPVPALGGGALLILALALALIGMLPRTHPVT